LARTRLEEVSSQRDALVKLAQIIRKGSIDSRIVQAARAITRGVSARDDDGELAAIFDAVKNGTDRVRWLSDGVRYVADPYSYDTYTTVNAMIEQCANGACAGDCDDMTILIGSLAAALGFKVGARAWGEGRSGDYSHVYAVAAVPKNGPWPSDYYGTALDPTMPNSYVGWEPSGGHIITAWIE